MLDTKTKRLIDTARDILVGKVPDPKSQVEQITIALIYKFMDDMDAESEELGGKRKFFASQFARYGWANLMHAGLGGFEILNLYAEAIAKMPENPGIPPLFRDIFKNAYLPYRDPETLKMFLKVIDEFNYDHSERLGDAFEYLLSVLGSQGDAGQFRTPRHIIDFMVEVIDPKKTETVLDPACGTAGFLISSYKHILKANTDAKGHSTLTPDEKGRLAQNFRGYDISPDMVRLSLVNMYLHGFVDPHIYEYDTLASQDKWNEYADVILANPPFMSPKGGIKWHSLFSVHSKRSEVLFVDYMAEHLTPTGRATIIVPEGIIFTSQTAYTQLRKLLVEEYLVAVISLPAGVFNPYSGVKTSILVLDKPLAKKANEILFLKIENDGTDLGTRRKAVANSDLPEALNACRLWITNLVSGERRDPKENLGGRSSLLVPKARISEDGDYNLTAERYRVDGPTTGRTFPMAKIGSLVAEISTRVKDRALPVWSVSNAMGFVNTGEYFDKQVASEDITNYKVVETRCFAYNPSRINVGSIALNSRNKSGAVSPMYVVFSVSDDALSSDYLFALLKSENLNREFNRVAQGGVRVQVRFGDLAELQIPLPPLDVQKEIVAEVEGYQKVINGARAVLDNYRPHVPIDPDWPMVPLGEHFATMSGGTPSKAEPRFWMGQIPWVSPKDMKSDLIEDTEDHISEEAVEASATKLIPAGSVVCVVRSGILKHSFPVALLGRDMCINQDLVAFRPTTDAVISKFLFYVLKTNSASIIEKAIKPGVTVQSFYNGFFRDYAIPLPTLVTQRAIVAEIEAEQALVAANRELITRFEKKIQVTLARVWGSSSNSEVD